MRKGILIFAHNSRAVDYGLMSLISGGLAKKYLNMPVSLVTDSDTINWMEESGLKSKVQNIFEEVIITERPRTGNYRKLHDGTSESAVAFINYNRCNAWSLTPYERTLLIDSDFLIFSKALSEYWDIDSDLLVGDSINDIYDQARLGYNDRYISEVGVKLCWATTVLFTKNEKTKIFFDLVEYIRDNYQYFSDLYRFDHRQYRNDIAFSIAKHILDGFENPVLGNLPPVLTLLDKDILHSVDKENLKLMISQRLDGNYFMASLRGTDIHVMNKQSIIRNSKELLEMI